MAEKEAKLKVKIQGEGFDDYSKKVEKAKQSTDKLSTSIKSSLFELNNGFGKAMAAVGLLKLPSAIKGIANGFNSLIKISEKGTAIVEENNLFMRQFTNVRDAYIENSKVTSDYYKAAIDYQKELNRVTGLNQVETMKTQGSFFQLFNAQKVAEDVSYNLSKYLSNAAIDLSSLFNVDYDAMVTKLRSGIIGNSRPLRELGIDVTEGTMQGVLDNLGIDKMVDELSFAEKEILRYRTIVQQVGFAQGDFAATFDQAANQIRIFKSQIETIKQQVSAIFAQLVQNIGVYVRAALMIVSAFLKALGSLIGVDWTDTGNKAGAALGEIGDGFDDVSSGIGGATKQAKEFRKQIMGFDEINNITPPTKASGSGGAGGVGAGSVSPELLKGLEEWNSQLDLIDNKAREVANDFLKIFGLTIDENGELKKVDDRFDKIREAVKILAGVMATVWAINKIVQFIEWCKKVKDAFTTIKTALSNTWTWFSNTWLGKKITSTISDITMGFSILGNNISTYTKWGFQEAADAGAGFFGKIKGGLAGMKEGWDASMKNATVKAGLTKTALIAEVAALVAVVKTGIENIDNNILAMTGNLRKATGEETTSAGEKFLAFCRGAAEGVVSIFDEGTRKSRENRQELINFAKQLNDDMQKTYESVVTNTNVEIELASNYADKLRNIVDENGNIADSHAKEAQTYIQKIAEETGADLEFKNNHIYYNGEMLTSDDQVMSKINELIAKRREQALVEGDWTLYKQALENKSKAEVNAEQLHQKYLQSQSKEDYEAWQNAEKLVNEASRTVDTYYKKWVKDTVATTGEINGEFVKSGALTTQDLSKILHNNKKNFDETYESVDKDTKMYMLKMVSTNKENLDLVADKWAKFSKDTPDTFNLAMDTLDSSNRITLMKILGQTKADTPEIQAAFKHLAETSEGEYNVVMGQLPETQRKLLEKMTGVVTKFAPEQAKQFEETFSQNVKGAEKGMSLEERRLMNDKSSGFHTTLHLLNTAKDEADSHSPSREFQKIGAWLMEGFYNGIEGSWARSSSYSSMRNFISKIKNIAHDGLQIGSPSKLTKQYGAWLMEGFEIGIDEQAQSTENALQNTVDNLKDTLAEVQEYTADSMLIDATTMIDYGKVQGKIDAKIDTSGLTRAVAMAVIEGMNNANVNVKVEATTDTGVVIKQVSEAMNDYVNQTGQLPFAIPM